MISRITAWGRGRSELLVALFLLVLGVFVLLDAARLKAGIGQRGPVGPKALPLVIGALLVFTAVLLARDVLRGGRGEPEGGEDVDLSTGPTGGHCCCWRRRFSRTSPSSSVSAGRSRARCSSSDARTPSAARQFIRGPLIALALSIGSWYLFALGLGITLPVGVLKGIL